MLAVLGAQMGTTNQHLLDVLLLSLVDFFASHLEVSCVFSISIPLERLFGNIVVEVD
jgi:hypothetical protein